ncbi:hypothetical protein EXM22_01875 [Oceanispirochaeta crateris]|uniref:Uncharacterized protein n=1 Tax=Oceanispirochaeta crateris TaxID=2518645 RepID=A0A5C1QHP4_9SPIO|nr:hypothetical protein [Oceanispirochaeta crateris]QEN06798.1 hypothetical protein EXM22_01875 [Oceanispirochaeta crateris]
MSDLEIIIVPEEEIYLAVFESLNGFFPELVSLCNAQKGENWIKSFSSVIDSYDEKELKPLPLVRVHLNEVKKKSSDPFVELGEYFLILECRFERCAPNFIAYRYAALIQKWLDNDETISSLIDRFILDECQVSPLSMTGAPGYPEATYTIRLYRDRIK